MKFLKTVLFFAFISFFVLSCSKSTTPTNVNPSNVTLEITFTLNGGTYTNQTFTYDAGGIGVYLSNQNATGLTFSGKTQGQGATITFTGNATGTYSFSSKNAMVIMMADNSQIAVTSGSLIVSSYGAIGEYITGTFSGSGINSTAQAIQITNGSFTAKRAS